MAGAAPPSALLPPLKAAPFPPVPAGPRGRGPLLPTSPLLSPLTVPRSTAGGGRGVAFPPGPSLTRPRPFLSGSGGLRELRRERYRGRGFGGVGGGTGLPSALLQPCFSLRRHGGGMWRRPAWQVGPGGGGVCVWRFEGPLRERRSGLPPHGAWRPRGAPARPAAGLAVTFCSQKAVFGGVTACGADGGSPSRSPPQRGLAGAGGAFAEPGLRYLRAALPTPAGCSCRRRYRSAGNVVY